MRVDPTLRTFRRICVYGGSSPGNDPVYSTAAGALGRHLAERGIGVVFGGGSIGLMGSLADAALAAGGEVIGVIPEKLQDLELGHAGVTALYVVDTMHERKAKMAELSDGFIAMPGGFGTLEEVFEAVTWTQLRYHDKPAGLLNTAGYFDALIGFVQQAMSAGFIREVHHTLLQHADDPPTLIDAMARAHLPELNEWLTT